MKKNKIIKMITMIGLIGISISSLSTIKASAAWKENNTGWWYTEGRSWATGWRNINNEWYSFGSDGYMETDWILDGSKWYYLNQSGAMLSNTITTDGYTLNYDGSWNTSIPKKTISTIINKDSLSNVDKNNTKIDETSVTTDSGLNNEIKDNNTSNTNTSINNSTSHNDALNNNITQQIQTNTEQVSVNNEKQIGYDKFNDIVCDEMHRLVNEHRKNNGVPELETKSNLDISAYLKSKDMIDNNYFEHDHDGVSFDKIAYKLSRVNINGENIAYNYITDNKYAEESAKDLANALFTQWKKSPGHNANMLNKDYKAFGFGFMLGEKDGNYTKVYATQQFVLKDFNYQKNIVQDTDSNTNTNSIIYVNEVELDTNNGKDVLNVGETKIIRARILPTNANNRSVKWKSSDKSVVSVDNGKITANHVGIAYITCTTEDGSNFSATDEIHVVDCTHVSITNNISVTSISIHPNQIVTPLGYKCVNNFKATLLPDNATDKSLTWKSSDESVATVDSNGNITPVGKGKAIITCTANDGSQESESGIVTIY